MTYKVIVGVKFVKAGRDLVKRNMQRTLGVARYPFVILPDIQDFRVRRNIADRHGLEIAHVGPFQLIQISNQA